VINQTIRMITDGRNTGDRKGRCPSEVVCSAHKAWQSGYPHCCVRAAAPQAAPPMRKPLRELLVIAIFSNIIQAKLLGLV